MPVEGSTNRLAEALRLPLLAITTCVPWMMGGITKDALKVPSRLGTALATATPSNVIDSFRFVVKPEPLTVTESRTWTELGVSVIVCVTANEVVFDDVTIPTVA